MEKNSRITLQPAYVLHRRPFRNTSLLVDLFTLDFGLIRAVAKGARRQKSRSRALLQLFRPDPIRFMKHSNKANVSLMARELRKRSRDPSPSDSDTDSTVSSDEGRAQRHTKKKSKKA